MTITTSVIIPAYNEAERIKKVIQPLLRANLADEIIVVDDFSSDNTSEVASKYPKVKVIRINQNIGKTNSLFEGVKQSSGTYVLFLDADLVGLTSEDIDNLIRPVVNGLSNQSIAFRKKDPFFFTYIINGNPFVSGERCMRKDDFNKITGINNNSGFSFEMLANKYFLDHKMKIAIVTMENLRNIMKFEKRGIFSGWIEDIGMAAELIKIFGLVEMLRQAIFISQKFHLRYFIKKETTVIL